MSTPRKDFPHSATPPHTRVSPATVNPLTPDDGDDDDNTYDNSFLPGTPPSKKVRKYWSDCMQASEMLVVVLVEN